jgi:hypothetical protein
MWQITDHFSDVTSFGEKSSEVRVVLKNGRTAHNYCAGHLTCLKKGRTFPLYRIFFDEAVKSWLRNEYLMSYALAVEEVLSKKRGVVKDKTVHSWEFLDIEYDFSNKTFYLVAHYKHEPSFPNLFEYLARTDLLTSLPDCDGGGGDEVSVLDQ